MSLGESFITGISTGISIFIANWASKKYIERKLDKTHDIVSKAIKGAGNFFIKGGTK